MIYFASDTHLGLCHGPIDPRQKEMVFVDWLKSLHDCSELFLLGDIFDFWYEYSGVVPKGFTRLLGQLASMSDSGVKIHYLVGNHDLWLSDYFQNELGANVYFSDLIVNISGKKILLSHGDALAGETTFLGKVFRSKFLKWFFQRLIHPDLVMRFGHWWSLKNRTSRSLYHTFKGENERLVKYARKALEKNPDIDYIICGHIHIPLVYNLTDKTKLIVLGQWVDGIPQYACMNDCTGELSLEQLK